MPNYSTVPAIRDTVGSDRSVKFSGSPQGRVVTTTAMNDRRGGTIVTVSLRLRLIVAMSAVLSVCAAGLPLLVLPAAGEAATQRQITTAFATLVKLPTVDRGSPYLEGYDAAMRSALQQAGLLVTEGYEVRVKVGDGSGPPRSSDLTRPSCRSRSG